MTINTTQGWILTDLYMIYTERGHDNHFRIWIVPMPHCPDRAASIDDTFSSVIDVVKWFEANYALDIDSVTVKYTNGCTLVVENEGRIKDWQAVSWHIEGIKLDHMPAGYLTEPMNRSLSLSIENIMDGIPSIWKSIEHAEAE